jgi:galactose mutarotase-like enzyme
MNRNAKMMAAFVIYVAWWIVNPGAVRAEPKKYLITSSTKNIHHANWETSGDGFSVKKRTLHGGKQEGVELITISNGVLEIDVIPTRGMSIYEVRHADMRLGWDSPVEGLVHPSYIDLESRGGLGWLEGFNEWMVRCGLEFAGHPGTDEFVNNTGETSSLDLTLHGKIGNTPASEVEVIVDDKPPYRIRVRGIVYEKFFYGPKLKLTTEVSVVPGEDKFRVEDSITNEGADDQEFQIIYHANFGQPLLEKGSRVHAAVREMAPMNEHAAEGLDSFNVYQGPTRGFVEEVFLIQPYADAAGQSIAVLQNARGDRAASLRWFTEELPFLNVWKNTAATEDGYVTGIEPATGYPFNRKVERKAGRVPKLAAGEVRSFTLEFGFHRGVDAVQAVIEQVEAIQNGRDMLILRKPPGTIAEE